MSGWSRIRTHFVFRVALGYLALVWLLALAIVVVFPMLEQPPGTAMAAISLLVAGFPIVLFLAWAFGDRVSAPRDPSSRASDSLTRLSRKIERAIIAVLVLVIATIGVNQFLAEEGPDNDTNAPVAEAERVTSSELRAPGPSNSIAIGILSPKEGSRLVPTGKAHEASAMLGFERMGPLRVGGSDVNVQFVPWNDEGDSDLARTLALQLVHEQGVATIIGPVNSESTAKVLMAMREEGIDIAVLSSLSTARDLIVSGMRDPNFFRLIFDDSGRMQKLAQFIASEKRGLGQQKFLFAYENDTYGRGLVNDLRSNFYSDDYETVTWCALVQSDCEDPDCELESICRDNSLGSELLESLATGAGLNPQWAERLSSYEFDNVVLLGTVPGAVALAQGMTQLQERLDFFLVGSNKQMFDDAPVGSVAIGNPVLDPSRAPNAAIMAEWNEILSLFEDKYGQDPADFVVTAYEAGMVIHSALQAVLEDRTEIPELTELRRGILAALERQSFDSLEPWRAIEFVDGRLLEPHSAPIYRITRGQARVDISDPRAWVEIDVPAEVSYMEGPIRVNLRGYGVDSARILLSRIQSGRPEIVRSRDVTFSANQATVDFHVFRTGAYRLSVQDVASTPSRAQTRMVLAPTYGISLITALLGALVISLRENVAMRARVVRVLLGMFAGFALTFSALYGAQVAGWFPFPKFGDEPYVNAIVTGLIGGLVGPYVLAEVFLSWALTLSLRRHDQRQAKDIPEGL